MSAAELPEDFWLGVPQAFGLAGRPMVGDPLKIAEKTVEDWREWALWSAVFPDFERLQALAAMPYQEYLRTDEWRARRKVMIGAMGHKCERCESKTSLHVHHKTYARRGYERMEDLLVLCAPCHRAEHGL